MGDIVYITDKFSHKMSNMMTNVHRKLLVPKLRKASTLSERNREHETGFFFFYPLLIHRQNGHWLIICHNQLIDLNLERIHINCDYKCGIITVSD